MTLKEWVAQEMIKRLNRVINHKIAWEGLDYWIFEVENKRGSFFTSIEDSNKWWKFFKKEAHVYVADRLMQVNGLTFEELKHMEKKELELLIINNLAEEILEKMPEDIYWEIPVVWTKELFLRSGLGKYMNE